MGQEILTRFGDLRKKSLAVVSAVWSSYSGGVEKVGAEVLLPTPPPPLLLQ